VAGGARREAAQGLTCKSKLARQGVTQHLDVLEAANLVAETRAGEAALPEPRAANLKSLLETGAIALDETYPVAKATAG
jgi:hypothetical protein